MNMKKNKNIPTILNSELYLDNDGINDGESIIEEIPIEPVSNDYLEQVVSRHVSNVRQANRNRKRKQ